MDDGDIEHCEYCDAEPCSGINTNKVDLYEDAVITANQAMTKDGEGLSFNQLNALRKAIREVK